MVLDPGAPASLGKWLEMKTTKPGTASVIPAAEHQASEDSKIRSSRSSFATKQVQNQPELQNTLSKKKKKKEKEKKGRKNERKEEGRKENNVLKG